MGLRKRIGEKLRRAGKNNRIGLLIPGQGFQRVGMGRTQDGGPIDYLEAVTEEVKMAIDPIQVARVYDLMLVDASALPPGEKTKLQGEISRTDNAQLSLFLLVAALWRAYRANENNLMPSAVLGHSGGEAIAGYVAGAFDLLNTAKYIFSRSHYMNVANFLYPGGMIVVSSEEDIKHKTIERCLRDTGIEIANDNTPKQIILSGRRQELEWFVSKLRGMGFKAIIFNNVAGAYHHSLAMASAKEALDKLFASSLIEIKKPAIRWILNFSGTEEDDVKRLRILLPAQVANAVKWRQSIETCRSLGIKEFVVLGPGQGLIKMLNDFTWRGG